MSALRCFAHKVGTDQHFCQTAKEQVVEYGYNWFSGDSSKEQVMKVFTVAVNEAIQKKVDLRNEDIYMVNQELRELLEIQQLQRYISSSIVVVPRSWGKMLKTATSPLDMAKFLKKDAPQWFEHQFDIRWHMTYPRRKSLPAGEPNDYKFYEFCDKMDTTEHFKYKPRLAHVKATLYKECRKESVYDLRSITKTKLCPRVYIRTTRGWIPLRAAGKSKFNQENIYSSDLSWIDRSIFKFITENADEQNFESLGKSIAKPTLYWAVLEDNDFVAGKNLKLESIGKTQVYVGRADKGIRGRWISGTNHCAMMKKCLDNVCAMTTYDPSTLKGIQLVDARLVLAKVRKENTALFVIKTFDDDVEKEKIAEKKIEMRLKEVVKESCKNNSIKKEETRLRKELKKATDRLKFENIANSYQIQAEIRGKSST